MHDGHLLAYTHTHVKALRYVPNAHAYIHTCTPLTHTRTHIPVDKTTHTYTRTHQKGDALAKKMYKNLVSMHECFEKLTKTIEETGNITNQVHMYAHMCMFIRIVSFLCVCGAVNAS